MAGRDKSANGKGVERLPPHRAEEAVTVLCDSFHDYSAMRYIIGVEGDRYDRRLHTLIQFFVAARFLHQEPVLAISDEGQVVATAIMTPPIRNESPAGLTERREAVWQQLGAAALERYEALGSIWQEFTVSEPHYHLNMIGVHRSHSGRGLGRVLLDAVHEMSLEEPGSSGVALTTEDHGNVALYQRFGYEIVGHVKVSPELETWGFFRADDT
jgi:ribosomal protein S18 acetylase RimI-like enzyme